MRVVNLGLYATGCFLAGTGWLLGERMPHGRESHGLTFLGFRRHDWAELHEWVAYGSIALVVLHLLLNWQWLVVIASSRKVWRAALGLGAGVALIAVFAVLPLHRT